MYYEPYIVSCCKIHQGAACCKYLETDGEENFRCGKKVTAPIPTQAKWRIFHPYPDAEGDNCMGGDLDRIEAALLQINKSERALEKNSKKQKV